MSRADDLQFIIGVVQYIAFIAQLQTSSAARLKYKYQIRLRTLSFTQLLQSMRSTWAIQKMYNHYQCLTHPASHILRSSSIAVHL